MPERIKTSAKELELCAKQNICIQFDDRRCLALKLNYGHEPLSLGPILDHSECVHYLSLNSAFFLLDALHQNCIDRTASCIEVLKHYRKALIYFQTITDKVSVTISRKMKYFSKLLGNLEVRE